MNRLFFFVLPVFIFFTVSCSILQKKSDIEGPHSKDILSKDIESDSPGSDSGKIKGLETVFFAYDSSTLSDKTKKTLKKNVKWIQNKKRVKRVELEGHCDSMGSEAYNVGLGLRRAQSVKTFLISLGVSADQFSIVSYGEERPISMENARNRRVNFVPIY